MPSKTDKQRRAMAAAAAGNSTIGIPQSVGREFAKEDRKMPKSYSTGGTMSGAVGNPEYRHDGLKKDRNPQTRGTEKTGTQTGHGSRNKQTPSNYYVQDGGQKMQKCMASRMRSNKGRGSVSSKQFKGGSGMGGAI